MFHKPISKITWRYLKKNSELAIHFQLIGVILIAGVKCVIHDNWSPASCTVLPIHKGLIDS